MPPIFTGVSRSQAYELLFLFGSLLGRDNEKLTASLDHLVAQCFFACYGFTERAMLLTLEHLTRLHLDAAKVANLVDLIATTDSLALIKAFPLWVELAASGLLGFPSGRAAKLSHAG